MKTINLFIDLPKLLNARHEVFQFFKRTCSSVQLFVSKLSRVSLYVTHEKSRWSCKKNLNNNQSKLKNQFSTDVPTDNNFNDLLLKMNIFLDTKESRDVWKILDLLFSYLTEFFFHILLNASSLYYFFSQKLLLFFHKSSIIKKKKPLQRDLKRKIWKLGQQDHTKIDWKGQRRIYLKSDEEISFTIYDIDCCAWPSSTWFWKIVSKFHNKQHHEALTRVSRRCVVREHVAWWT